MRENQGWVIAMTQDYRGREVFWPFKDTVRSTRKEAWKAYYAVFNHPNYPFPKRDKNLKALRVVLVKEEEYGL